MNVLYKHLPIHAVLLNCYIVFADKFFIVPYLQTYYFSTNYLEANSLDEYQFSIERLNNFSASKVGYSMVVDFEDF